MPGLRGARLEPAQFGIQPGQPFPVAVGSNARDGLAWHGQFVVVPGQEVTDLAFGPHERDELGRIPASADRRIAASRLAISSCSCQYALSGFISPA
jgi:hypothetical protein